MNRSALKLPCAVLFGVVLGCAIGRPPWWSSEPGTESGQVQGRAMQSGPGAGYGNGLAGSGGEAGTGRAGTKPGLEQVEMLAAKFRSRTMEGEAERMRLILDIAELSAEEIGPVMELLMAAEDVNWEVMDPMAVRWGMLDPKAALDFAVGREGFGDDPDLMAPIVRELAKKDLAAAKAALNRLGEDERARAGMAVVHLLMRKDPRSALAYARELRNDEAETEALSSLAEKDPLTAAAELTPGKREQLPAVEAIASALMTRDRAAFEGWMESLKDPEWRVMALSAALSGEFQPDPKSAALEAAAWLTKEPGMSKEAGNLMGSIVQRWMEAKSPPAEVAAWAAGLPEGPARDSAVSAAGHLWIGEDTMAASNWLRTLPPGEPRDRAVLRLVQEISGETPADAFEWARTVESSKLLRAQTLMAAARVWVEKDLTAAEKAVETLPASDRDYLWNVLEAAKEKAAEQK